MKSTVRAASFVLLLGALGLAIAAAGAEEPTSRDLLAGGFAIALGAGLVLRAVLRIQEGEARLRSRTVRRRDSPGLFAVGIGTLLFPGIVLLVGGAWWLIAGS